MHAERPAIPLHDTLIQQHFRSTFRYWEQVYTERTVYSRIYQERARRALGYLDRLNMPSGSAILEVGCGPGIISTAMARKGFRVSAIDTLSEMAERTRTQAQHAGLEKQVTTQVASMDNLPFADATFDLAMVIGVTEWLAGLVLPLEEIRRVLKPAGYLIISADNSWPLHQMLDPVLHPTLKPVKTYIGKTLRRVGWRSPQPRTHAYSLKDFDSQLAGCGFVTVTSQTFGFGPFTFCNRKLLNEQLGWKLHLGMQRLADKGVPFFRSSGLVYMVLTKKLLERKTV